MSAQTLTHSRRLYDLRRLCHCVKMENIRDRKFLLLLYPDDPSHCDAVARMRELDYQFAGIIHTDDVGEDGEKLKPHWHFVVKFRNARWSNAVADELQIAHYYIDKCGSFDAALRYLVHADHPDKFQYEFNKVFGPLTPNVAKLLTMEDEGSRVLEIVRYIDDTDGLLSYRKVLIMACENGLYGEFRRLGSGVKWLLDEHNSSYLSPLQKQYVQGHSDSTNRYRKEV